MKNKNFSKKFKIQILEGLINKKISKSEATECLVNGISVPLHFHLGDDSILTEQEMNYRNGLCKLGVIRKIEWVKSYSQKP